MHTLALILHLWLLHQLGSYGSRKTWIWVVRVHRAGGGLLLGAWQVRPCSPPSVDSAASPQCPSLGVPPPTSVSASHLFLWAFCFIICFCHVKCV